MHALIGLLADLAIDARAVRDSVTALEGKWQRLGICDIDRMDRYARMLPEARVASILAASQHDHAMAFVGESFGKMSADKSRATGDGNCHDASLCLRRRDRIR